MFKRNDKVHDEKFGWGIVESTDNSKEYPLRVLFKSAFITAVSCYSDEGMKKLKTKKTY